MYKSNNWKKMHHIPIKSKTINGYEIKIIKLNEYCSPRSKKKMKKFRLKHCFTPNYKDILALMERSRNMAKEKKKELLPGYHWECKYCDGRLAKQSPYEEKKFMVCASCGAEWEDCKIPVPDESIW